MVSLLFEKETPDHSDSLILRVWFHSIPYGYKIIYSCRHLEVQFLCTYIFHSRYVMKSSWYTRLLSKIMNLIFPRKTQKRLRMNFKAASPWYSFGIPPKQNAERIFWNADSRNSFGVSIFRNGNSFQPLGDFWQCFQTVCFPKRFPPLFFYSSESWCRHVPDLFCMVNKAVFDFPCTKGANTK